MTRSMTGRRARAYAHVLQNQGQNFVGRVPLPRVAWLIPTWYCDLKCLTCSVWRRPRDPSDLSISEWRKVLHKVQFLDIVKLLGGEPFTREDLPELGEAIQEIIQPFIFQLVTAGKEPEQVEAFAKRVGAPNLHLRVSMDGLGEIHEKMRGTPGLHEKARETIDRLIPLRDKLGFQLGVNVAVNDQTLPHLQDLVDFCHGKGVNISPGLAVTPFLEEKDPKDHPPRVLMTSDRDATLKALRNLTQKPQRGYRLRERLPLNRFNDRVWHKMLDGAPAILDGPHCQALKSFCYLLPDGGVSACGLRQKSVGNLLEVDFLDLWHSKGAKNRRDEIEACVGCLQHSATVFSKMYSGTSRI